MREEVRSPFVFFKGLKIKIQIPYTHTIWPRKHACQNLMEFGRNREIAEWLI